MTTRLNYLARTFQKELASQQTLLWRYALTQACLESRWFQSVLVFNTNNAWGIKYHHQPGSYPYPINTTEYRDDGTRYQIVANFCRWDKVESAVSAYYSLVERHYQHSWRARTAHDYFGGLTRWATDPRYAESLNRVHPIVERLLSEEGL